MYNILPNTMILIILLLFSIIIFTDCKKVSKSFFTAFFWAGISIFLFPPLGVGLYYIYKKKGWL